MSLEWIAITEMLYKSDDCRDITEWREVWFWDWVLTQISKICHKYASLSFFNLLRFLRTKRIPNLDSLVYVSTIYSYWIHNYLKYNLFNYSDSRIGNMIYFWYHITRYDDFYFPALPLEKSQAYTHPVQCNHKRIH